MDFVVSIHMNIYRVLYPYGYFTLYFIVFCSYEFYSYEYIQSIWIFLIHIDKIIFYFIRNCKNNLNFINFNYIDFLDQYG